MTKLKYKELCLSGSTAIICIVIGKRLICVNCGDSKLLLFKNYDGFRDIRPLQLSKDHNLEDELEKKREQIIDMLEGISPRSADQHPSFGQHFPPQPSSPPKDL